MIIRFEGFDNSIEVKAGLVSELAVCNKTLFSRMVSSLLSERGELALEPYRLFSETLDPVASRGAFLVIESPFNLPWDNRQIAGALYSLVEARVFEEDEYRMELENQAESLRKSIGRFALSFQSDFRFDIEWDLKKFLKAFGYRIDLPEDASLLDNVTQFFSLASDVEFRKPLVLVGFDNYFCENDLKVMYDQAVFLGIPLLVMQNEPSSLSTRYLKKHIIDQHFLES